MIQRAHLGARARFSLLLSGSSIKARRDRRLGREAAYAPGMAPPSLNAPLRHAARLTEGERRGARRVSGACASPPRSQRKGSVHDRGPRRPFLSRLAEGDEEERRRSPRLRTDGPLYRVARGHHPALRRACEAAHARRDPKGNRARRDAHRSSALGALGPSRGSGSSKGPRMAEAGPARCPPVPTREPARSAQRPSSSPPFWTMRASPKPTSASTSMTGNQVRAPSMTSRRGPIVPDAASSSPWVRKVAGATKNVPCSRTRGAVPLQLGGRVLRAETAVFAGLTLLQHAYGDM